MLKLVRKCVCFKVTMSKLHSRFSWYREHLVERRFPSEVFAGALLPLLLHPCLYQTLVLCNGWCVQVTLETTTMDRVIQWSRSAYECATTYCLTMACIEKWKYMWVFDICYLHFFSCVQLTHTQTFNSLLSRTTWVVQYRKKDSPTHTVPTIKHPLSTFSFYYDPKHPPCLVLGN